MLYLYRELIEEKSQQEIFKGVIKNTRDIIHQSFPLSLPNFSDPQMKFTPKYFRLKLNLQHLQQCRFFETKKYFALIIKNYETFLFSDEIKCFYI